MSTLIMIMISGIFTGNTVNAVNHYDADSGKVVFEKQKKLEPKKVKKKPTIFGYEIKKVKPR